MFKGKIFQINYKSAKSADTGVACSSHCLLNQLLELKWELVVLSSGREEPVQVGCGGTKPARLYKGGTCVHSQAGFTNVFGQLKVQARTSGYSHKSLSTLVHLLLCNLPACPKEDNGLRIPISGITGARFLKACSLCWIFPSEHTFVECIFSTSLCPSIPLSS